MFLSRREVELMSQILTLKPMHYLQPNHVSNIWYMNYQIMSTCFVQYLIYQTVLPNQDYMFLVHFAYRC